MSRKRSLIPTAPMAEILKQCGAERVSDNAARVMADILMEKAIELAKDAVKFSKHAGRKTIKKEDVELARKGI